MSQQGNHSKDDLLVSWKDIAAYLKCSVRKAQRLEPRGLPVNRIPGTKSVWALKPDIDRWMTAEAETAKRHGADSAAAPANDGYAERAFFYGPMAVIGIPAGLTIAAAMTSAYGLTIVSFAITAALIAWIYPRLSDTSCARATIGLFVIAGMAYSASATTLPAVIDSTINMRVLRPAIAYPFIAGLRFIPIPVLISIFLAIPPLYGNTGFAARPGLRASYVLMGSLFLLTATVLDLTASGALGIWRAGLPIRWTLLSGEVFICAVNVALFLAGYRFFNTTRIQGYTPFLYSCGMAYLLIALTAAIVSRHWHEIDKHYLDLTNRQAYRIQNIDAERDLQTLLQTWAQNNTAEAGSDLMRLSGNPEFLRALRNQEFYKRDFDEAFQVSHKAVIFGYKSGQDGPEKPASFVLVRFPAALSAALRFEPVQRDSAIGRSR